MKSRLSPFPLLSFHLNQSLIQHFPYKCYILNHVVLYNFFTVFSNSLSSKLGWFNSLLKWSTHCGADMLDLIGVLVPIFFTLDQNFIGLFTEFCNSLWHLSLTWPCLILHSFSNSFFSSKYLRKSSQQFVTLYSYFLHFLILYHSFCPTNQVVSFD